MLKVKKKIHKANVDKNQDDEISKIQDDLKKLYKKSSYQQSKKKRKKKTIDEYAQLTTNIRGEYAKLQQENNQLEIELHK